MDPEDPRFQAFSVGFGPDFDAAESQATTINQRFSSQSDGSGYGVLLRETWVVVGGGVAEGAVAVGDERGTSPPDGPICTERASSEGCWTAIANHPGCFLWNPAPREDVTATWTGGCSNGLAQGEGRIDWFQNGVLLETAEVRHQDGRGEGSVIVLYPSGAVWAEGSLLKGKHHGPWAFYDENGNETGRQRFENGRPIGGPESAVEVGGVAVFTPLQLSSPTARYPSTAVVS